MLVCMTRELIDERRRNWPGDLGGQRVGQTWRRLRGWLGEVLADLLALLWPCACLMCGAPNRQLCPDCRARLRATVGTAQLARSSSGREVWVYGSYVGALRALLVACKHGGAVRLAAPLGELLSGPLLLALESQQARAPALLVTAPSRAARVRARGYRHVDLLVRRALRCLRTRGDPGPYLVVGGLQALPGRTGQVGLRAGERERNAALVRVPKRMLGRLRGREVVLVDDIVTTGATLDAAATALEAAGATVIATVALAAAERRSA